MFNKIWYHADCNDGLTAAYLALRHNPGAALTAVRYGEPPPMVTVSDRILIVDFSYARDVLEQLGSTVDELLVLDHHKTAEAELAGCRYAKFDQTKCGVTMVWDLYYPNLTRMPTGLKLIEARDLWSKDAILKRQADELTAGLSLIDSPNCDTWLHAVMENWASTCEAGSVVLKAQQALINRMRPLVRIVESKEWGRIGVLNSNTLISDVGNAMLRWFDSLDFAAVWYEDGAGVYKWSLRSDDNRMDVSEVAKFYGGGGHRNAAGFMTFSKVW